MSTVALSYTFDNVLSGVGHILHEDVARQGLRVVETWQHHFREDGTWVQREYGIPSFLVRLDCVINLDGNLCVYEVEERPMGAGVCMTMSKRFSQLFARIKKTWPEFRYLTLPSRPSTIDDFVWLDAGDECYQGLVLLRACPRDDLACAYVDHSVSSVLKEGDKTYGEHMGMWSVVDHEDQLPFEASFTLKPMQGTHAKDVVMWTPRSVPRSVRKWYDGVSTESQVRKVFRGHGCMYLQPFYPPMPSGIEEFPWMIYRIFYGFDVKKNRWECLGGAGNVRKNVKIHGASDSRFFPVDLA